MSPPLTLGLSSPRTGSSVSFTVDPDSLKSHIRRGRGLTTVPTGVWTGTGEGRSQGLRDRWRL